jgi:hypothetical protein
VPCCSAGVWFKRPASYLILQSVGLYVFNSIGLFATSRHVLVPNSLRFLDDAFVEGTVCCGFA